MYGLDATTLRNSAYSLNGVSTSAMESNGTINHMPNPFGQANLLEAFLPQYSLLARVMRDILGLDIGLILSACLMLYSISTSVQYLWSIAYAFIIQHFTSTIAISNEDDIYRHVMAWQHTQRLTTHNHRLTAETDWGATSSQEPQMKDGFVNFASSFRRSSPRFAPAHGQHWFRHKGRFFEFSRIRPDREEINQPDETLIISCIGRSTQPIKALLADCKDAYYAKKVANTSISRPRGIGEKYWSMVASRRSRPIDTVVLDGAQKHALLADMDEFLRPATATWYAERGIPYRRGYLFHGPPGTGKTSLSFAAAGVFGLDVYCLSLMDSTLTEENLLSLFSSLPSRCIVLLEDVDTAGLAKRKGLEGSGEDDDDDDEQKKKDGKSSNNIGNDSNSSNGISPSASTDPSGRKGITLSGLLNAIDGVASHEGRLLVLTTNKAAALDAALCRPGRVDHQVEFRYADTDQIADLFTRMYAGSADSTPQLAQRFAARLDGGVWSPAEIQGFLLTHKKDPLAAVEKVGAWREEQLAKKMDKKKLQEKAREGAGKEKVDAEAKDGRLAAEQLRSEARSGGWIVPWIAR